jgi:hypothetical protein
MGINPEENGEPKSRFNSSRANLPKYIAAKFQPQRVEPDNIIMIILNEQPRICIA